MAEIYIIEYVDCFGDTSLVSDNEGVVLSFPDRNAVEDYIESHSFIKKYYEIHKVKV